MDKAAAWLRANKEAIMKYFCAAAAIVLALLVAAAGCRRIRQEPPAPEVQAYEISNGTNFVAQTAEVIEVEADIFLADRPAPVRTRLRIRPGTWVVPEQMLDIGGPMGDGTVCTGKYCEAKP